MFAAKKLWSHVSNTMLATQLGAVVTRGDQGTPGWAGTRELWQHCQPSPEYQHQLHQIRKFFIIWWLALYPKGPCRKKEKEKKKKMVGFLPDSWCLSHWLLGRLIFVSTLLWSAPEKGIIYFLSIVRTFRVTFDVSGQWITLEFHFKWKVEGSGK